MYVQCVCVCWTNCGTALDDTEEGTDHNWSFGRAFKLWMRDNNEDGDFETISCCRTPSDAVGKFYKCLLIIR